MYVVGFIIQILNSKMTTMGVGTSLRGGGKGASQLFQRMKIKPLPWWKMLAIHLPNTSLT